MKMRAYQDSFNPLTWRDVDDFVNIALVVGAFVGLLWWCWS